jgi:nucleoside-diphosphate-sugar epimerase
MKKLIIGCGYVGRRLAARWQQQGHEVFATTRKPERAAEFAALGWNPIICDILNPLAELPAVDVAVIAVGFDRRSGRTMREVYVDGLRQVLPAIPGGCKLIYISSTSVYGQTNGEWVDENSETIQLESSGQVVWEAEAVLRGLRPDGIILRFAGIYGPNRLLREQALWQGKPIAARPDRWLNVIQVDDGVRAIEAAETKGKTGDIYNVADNEPVHRTDFFNHLAEQLGAPAPRFEPVPEAKGPSHEITNRRISNRRMREELEVELKYPNYREGISASASMLAGDRSERSSETSWFRYLFGWRRLSAAFDFCFRRKKEKRP